MASNPSLYDFIHRWDRGLPAELWLSQKSVIGEFIEQNKLQPLAVEAYPIALEQMQSPEAVGLFKSLQEVRLWPKPFPGGIRAPHLHFDGEVFALDRRQWQEFSTMVVRDVRSRLSRVRSLDFEQTLDLNEAARRL